MAGIVGILWFRPVLEIMMQKLRDSIIFLPRRPETQSCGQASWFENWRKVGMLEFPVFFAHFGGLCGSAGIVGIYRVFLPILKGYAAICARS